MEVQEATPDTCPECKDLTVLADGKRFDVWLGPGNRPQLGKAHKCKECVNCGAKYANRDLHHEQKGHRPDELVTCNHIFHHCTTWEEKRQAAEAIDYVRRVGDMAAIQVLLEKSKWCPNLGGVPPRPEGTEESK